MSSSPDPIRESDGQPQLVRVLPRHVSSARHARRAVAELLDGRIATTRLHDIQLIVSELVTNALRHGTGEVVLRVSIHDDELHISVSDSAEEEPRLQPQDPTRPGGLGLHIVDQLSILWGVARFPGGKTVWSTVELPPRR
jgi:anti-sigma regulatory factor (Ser/Thr protein kinase)